MKKRSGLKNFIITVILICLLFKPAVFVVNEITDLWAYKNAPKGDEAVWSQLQSKFDNKSSKNRFTDEDYENIFMQSGLGKPAVDKLCALGQAEKINTQREYYQSQKKFKCERTGIFACNEHIADENKNLINNPPFVDIQDGDILITLSIHSLGWRHGHAGIVTNAHNGTVLGAQMMGLPSNLSSINEWSSYPRVAVLRAKNTDITVRRQIAKYAEENFVDIEYSLFADYNDKMKDEEKGVPEKTHCANIIKTIYGNFNIDVDSNGGKIVTPNEILQSENFEVVQIYGNMRVD